MIDLKSLDRDFQKTQDRLLLKGVNSKTLERLKTAYHAYKSSKQELESAQAQQNSDSKLFGQYMKEKRDTAELKERVNLNKRKIAELQESVREHEELLNELALTLPNLPDERAPRGQSEEENIVIETKLKPRGFNFTPKEHWELSEKNNWIDFETGVKLSKSRFSLLQNEGAKLERALINYMLDFNAKYGFEEVSVPYIVNAQTMEGTGQLPKFEDDLFKMEGEDLYLIPTAEVPLTSMFRDEIIDEESLPIKLTSHTPCFRREAGSGGRDIRGLIRQHQFHKVELVAITKPDQSKEIFDLMVNTASELLSSLNLPHRLVNLCTGDLGFSAAYTTDIEVWLPGQNQYREISSVSNTYDFQARRAKIRYRNGKKNALVHTLNGSSLAVGRTLVAIMENFQNENGTIEIPEVLKEYL